MKKPIFLLIFAVFLILGVFASDDDLFFSDENLFFDEVIIEEVIDENAETSSIFDFNIIETNKVDFGGNASFSLGLQSMWQNPFIEENQNAEYWLNGFKNAYLIPSLYVSLHFDARPSETLRIYGKAETQYPFEITVPGLTIPQVKVVELFTDFNIGEYSYFRFGKHSVKWGVGYFFSPADVINIGKIDPEEPEKDVEGAISLRSMFTFSGTQNCLYLYLIPDLNSEKGYLAKNVAFAGKYDFLVGNTEIGIGGWYKNNRPPKMIGTFTSTLFDDIPVYGEVVLAYGLEEQWLKEAEKDFIFQGTTGFSYTFKEPKINLAMQYFFNGFGVKNPSEIDDITFNEKASLYSKVGQHYLAVAFSKSEVFNEKFSLSGFGQISFSDFSGMGNLNINYNLDRNCSFSFGPSLVFGKENSEFARSGKILSINLSVTLGGGSF